MGIDLRILGWLMSLESPNLVVVDLLSIPAMLLRREGENRAFLLMKSRLLLYGPNTTNALKCLKVRKS